MHTKEKSQATATLSIQNMLTTVAHDYHDHLSPHYKHLLSDLDRVQINTSNNPPPEYK